MMVAIVERDEAAVADLLERGEYPETVYAAPASRFWMWADNDTDESLNLVLPPGDVTSRRRGGFPSSRSSGLLALHVDVRADWGRRNSTILSHLAPEGDGYPVELHVMHVM